MILAIDANSQLHADWKAAPERAADLFVRRVYELIDARRPTRTVCAFDTPGRTFRHELFEGYKANRDDPDQGLLDCIAEAREKLLSPIETVNVEGFEADDIIATVVAHRGSEQVIIFSRDKDCRQLLVAGKVIILRSLKSSFGNRKPDWFSAGRLYIDCGLTPCQWVDFQCLVGDSVDGIKGVKGIGKDTARKLLEGGKRLPDILNQPWGFGLSERRRNALIAFRERYPLVRQLLTLRTDVPGIQEAQASDGMDKTLPQAQGVGRVC